MANSNSTYSNGAAVCPVGKITYNSVILDRFGNFDKDTGIFRAPRDGVYAFFFSGYLNTTGGGTLRYYVNGKRGSQYIHTEGTPHVYRTHSAYWSLKLLKGDEMYLHNDIANSLHVTVDYQLHFMGMSV